VWESRCQGERRGYISELASEAQLHRAGRKAANTPKAGVNWEQLRALRDNRRALRGKIGSEATAGGREGDRG
jgi:hypothetical protein